MPGDIVEFVKRAAWGAAPSRYPLVKIDSTRGVKVHYEGTAVPVWLVDRHDQCDDRMRALQRSHLNNDAEDYSDIAYNLVVCPHGRVYEGRGAGRKCGANGNAMLNSAHYAVCAMLGSSGYVRPTDEQLHGLRDAIEYLRDHGGAGTEIRGHRDGYATACPGERLYAWVQRGAPRPGLPTVSLAAVVYAATHSRANEERHPEHADDVGHVQDALVANGRLRKGAFRRGIFDQPTADAYEEEQRAQGYTGHDADGVPGPASLERLGRWRFNVVKEK